MKNYFFIALALTILFISAPSVSAKAVGDSCGTAPLLGTCHQTCSSGTQASSDTSACVSATNELFDMVCCVRPNNGQSCTGPSDCSSNYCDTTKSPSVCAPKPAANGIVCSADSQCASGYCAPPADFSPAMCATPPSAVPISCGSGGNGICKSRCDLNEYSETPVSCGAGMVCCAPRASAAATGGALQNPGGSPTGQLQNPGGNQNTDVTLLNPLQGQSNCGGGGQQSCLQAFLMGILDFVIKIGTIAIVLMMVLVGYRFVAAQGAPGQIEEAKSTLLWTVVGALILLGAKAIALGIEATVQAISQGH